MSVNPNSPWFIDLYGTPCETGTSYERLEKIRKSENPKCLSTVAAWPDQQPTVTKAAERRLRVLAKKEIK